MGDVKAPVADDQMIAEMRKVAEDATPGPWIRSGVRYKFAGKVDCLTVGPDKAGAPKALFPIGTTHNEHAEAIRDADYLRTFSPESVLAILNRLEAAEAERDALKAQEAKLKATLAPYRLSNDDW